MTPSDPASPTTEKPEDQVKVKAEEPDSRKASKCPETGRTTDWLTASSTVALAILTIVLTCITAWYATLTHKLVLLGVEPAVDVSLGEALGTSISIANRSSEPVDDVHIDLRCGTFAAPATYQSQALGASFSGDWATAPQLAANSILTKDAGEFLSVCRQSEEQARKDLSSAPNVPKVAGVPDLRVVVAFDVSYRRHVDQKLYHSSIGAFLSEPPYRMFLQRNYTSTNFSPAIQDLLNH